MFSTPSSSPQTLSTDRGRVSHVIPNVSMISEAGRQSKTAFLSHGNTKETRSCFNFLFPLSSDSGSWSRKTGTGTADGGHLNVQRRYYLLPFLQAALHQYVGLAVSAGGE